MISADGGACTGHSHSFTMMTSQDQARLLATIKKVAGGNRFNAVYLAQSQGRGLFHFDMVLSP
ncbi:hypothetical protein [Rhizobium sp.]|uniref:hypothetical protein n=1 Tax=Rhizobium sp. TaxID=391 RepID=UPI0034C66EEF